MLSLKCKFNGQEKEMRENTMPPSALPEKQEQINDVGKMSECWSKMFKNVHTICLTK